MRKAITILLTVILLGGGAGIVVASGGHYGDGSAAEKQYKEGCDRDEEDSDHGKSSGYAEENGGDDECAYVPSHESTRSSSGG